VELLEGPSGGTLDAAFLSSIPAVSKRVRADGSGSVTFGGNSGMAARYANSGMEFFVAGWGARGEKQIGFVDLPEAALVADLVTAQRREAA
jgi:hypothetical protein